MPWQKGIEPLCPLPLAFSRRAASNHKFRATWVCLLHTSTTEALQNIPLSSTYMYLKQPTNMPTPRSQKPVVGIKTNTMLKHHSALILFRTASSAVIVVGVVTVVGVAFNMKPHAEKIKQNIGKTRLQRRHQQPPHSQRGQQTKKRTMRTIYKRFSPVCNAFALATRASLCPGVVMCSRLGEGHKVPACRTPCRPKCGELWRVAAAARGAWAKVPRVPRVSELERAPGLVEFCLLDFCRRRGLQKTPERLPVLHRSSQPSSEAFQLHRVGSKAQRTGPSGWTSGLEHSTISEILDPSLCRASRGSCWR